MKIIATPLPLDGGGNFWVIFYLTKKGTLQ
jgi:hypothetical protein